MVSTRRGKANALVIGGAGFLGQHMVRALLRSGTYQVQLLAAFGTHSRFWVSPNCTWM